MSLKLHEPHVSNTWYKHAGKSKVLWLHLAKYSLLLTVTKFVAVMISFTFTMKLYFANYVKYFNVCSVMSICHIFAPSLLLGN